MKISLISSINYIFLKFSKLSNSKIVQFIFVLTIISCKNIRDSSDDDEQLELHPQEKSNKNQIMESGAYDDQLHRKIINELNNTKDTRDTLLKYEKHKEEIHKYLNNKINKRINETESLINPNSKMKAQFSKEYPNYRIMHPGLNFEGQCNNSLCSAYGKYTWSPVGFYNQKDGEVSSTFVLGEEITKSKCPLCRSILRNVKGFCFYKCIAEYEANDFTRNKLVEEICVYKDSNNFIYNKITPEWLSKYYYIKVSISPIVDTFDE